MTLVRSSLSALFAATLLHSLASGQGVFIDRPADRPVTLGVDEARLELRSHRVEATVKDTFAHYSIEQVFRNRTGRRTEGTYVFPIPREATATGLALTMNGAPIEGEVLEATRARGIYQEIVRRSRDPALLEYLGCGMMRASIFPIEPHAEVKIQLRFATPVSRVGDLYELKLPLRFTADSNAALTVDARLESSLPLSAIYSPTHPADVAREGDRNARVTFEGKPTRRGDFILYYGRRETDELGVSLLCHRLPANDGTFVLVLAPPPATSAEPRAPRDVVFVLDRSGSMAGEKWNQATEALKFGLRTLDEVDRFALVSFATDVRTYKPTLTNGAKEEIRGAEAHLEQLRPSGGTNIAGALADSLALLGAKEDDRRVRLVAFLTDGLPTIDETDSNKILARLNSADSHGARIFSFGVGYDVNTFLLDRIAEDHHGVSDYVEEGESIEVRVSAFFDKVRSPFLSNPTLSFEGAETWDVFPPKLPDLYRGSSVVVAGRYRGHGPHALVLRGQGADGPATVAADIQFPKEQLDHDFVPPLWAARKVGYLLNQIRLHGANRELIDQVIEIGRTHGIVTPYTSGLVLEEGTRLGRIAGAVPPAPESKNERESVRRAEESARAGLEALDLDGRSDSPAATGHEAVKKSKLMSGLSDAVVAEARSFDDGGARAPVNVAGRTLVRIEDTYVDLAFRAEMRPALTTIAAFSEAYFDLIDAHPELASLLALGSEIVFVLDGKAVHVTAGA